MDPHPGNIKNKRLTHSKSFLGRLDDDRDLFRLGRKILGFRK
jgi:hypothetical protein